MTIEGRLGVLTGTLLCCYVLVWCGWHLALWAVRTGRVDLAEIKKALKG